MMARMEDDDGDPNATPVVRIKLPWPFIATVIGGGSIALLTASTSVARLTDEVRELKAAVQAGNALVTTLQVAVGRVEVTATDTQRRLDHHLENLPRREQ